MLDVGTNILGVRRASVVDHAVIGHDMFQNIIYFTVHPLTLLSNHCCILFVLRPNTFQLTVAELIFCLTVCKNLNGANVSGQV